MSSRTTKNTRQRVWLRDGGICWLCRRWLTFKEMTADHFIPRSKGGSDEVSNLKTACERCNTNRGDKWPVGVDADDRIVAQKRDELLLVK